MSAGLLSVPSSLFFQLNLSTFAIDHFPTLFTLDLLPSSFIASHLIPVRLSWNLSFFLSIFPCSSFF